MDHPASSPTSPLAQTTSTAPSRSIDGKTAAVGNGTHVVFFANNREEGLARPTVLGLLCPRPRWPREMER